MIIQDGNKIIRRFDKELLQIEPYGKNSLRIRATQLRDFSDDRYSALIPESCNEFEQSDIAIQHDDNTATISNGKISCEILCTGKIKFYNKKKELLLEEYDKNRFRRISDPDEPDSALEIPGRWFRPIQGTDNFETVVRFEAKDRERLYGMGQYNQPYLDQKGCVLELAQRNSQITIPFVLSSRGYGMLWNNPAIGKASFGKNVTEWTSDSTKQIDYWITAGDTPAEIEEAYADITGKVPMMPDYGTGLWQSKLRYRTQEEVLNVAREYRKRKLPLSVMVIDFFHWTAQGDFKFDPEYWPDPQAMVDELKNMGIELMVSVWPTVEESSENYREMEEKGYLIRTEMGPRLGIKNKDTYMDATNPEARKYVWEKLKKNYFDKGIHLFWLDECEPELSGYEYDNYRFYQGSDKEIGNTYPKDFAKMVYDGRSNEGEDKIVSLVRCAWAGSQKYGALVWTGDVASTFESLRNQLAAGLNMGLSGMPWWTTDIGGFHGGDVRTDSFRECFVRWFEFGTFCPVMRMHGFRQPLVISETGKTFVPGDADSWKYTSGSPNEVWSFGDDIYEICKYYLNIRDNMRPYIMEQMEKAHDDGTPVMRPLFYDYPNDKETWAIEDEYMFGPDVLVAPVLYAGKTEREVYLPDGEWVDLHTGQGESGNQTLISRADLQTIPVYIKKQKYCNFSFSHKEG